MAELDFSTLKGPIKDFLYFEKVARNHSENTIYEYYKDLRTFFRFMKRERGIADPQLEFEEIPLDDIDLEFIRSVKKTEINAYVNYLRAERKVNEGKKTERQGISPAATQRKIATLRSFFGYFCDYTMQIDRNPAANIIVPKIPKKVPQYLTAEECKKLLKAVDGKNDARDYAIILIFLSCGLRLSEVANMNVDDLRYNEGTPFITITGKGSKEREVFLSENCIEALEAYLAVRKQIYAPTKEDADALFLSRKHNRLSTRAIQTMVEQTMLKAGLKRYSPHKLRHTTATMMVQNGVDTRVVQVLLGHESLSTTQIYTHASDENLANAALKSPISRIHRK